MAIDLVFGRPRYAGGAVDLVFGGGDGEITPDPVTVTGSIVFGGLSISAFALYDNRNPRRVTNAAAMPWEPAGHESMEPLAPWTLSKRELEPRSARWEVAAHRLGERSSGWMISGLLASTVTSRYSLARHVLDARDMVYQAARKLDRFTASSWDTSASRSVWLSGVYQAALTLLAGGDVSWQVGRSFEALGIARHGSGTPRAVRICAPWEISRVPPSGREVWPPPGTGVQPPRVISTHLVFACPPWAGGSVTLIFGRVCGTAPPHPGATLFILPARFYMAVHSLTAHRLPDLTEIPIFDLQLSADSGSFAWTFSARAPVGAFDALAPTSGLPAQLRITLDDIEFVFLVDSLAREDRFGARSVRLAGRSVTALLAAPYAREATWLNAEASTAQQLAESALEFSGATLDWGITDWLVPAGSWSHRGTPLSALTAIVQAAGGYLQSHRSSPALLARHPYPELPGGITGGPWNWAGGFAADVELAPDALMTRGIERRDGPDINGVYVSGQSAGVLALVKRTGTAADKLASMVVDPLITASEAAGQRGLAIVGAGGPKHLVQIEVPVLTGAGQPGVLNVGQLVQVNDSPPWRARVRGVSVNATMPKVRQALTLERHLETTP